ncbi:hypothetical protein ABZ388_06950 [Micromonospora parva]|uniref:hypothetical protein n=1 Tax=Micromonospora parva TaxID=1464048 RepID=UPI003409B9D8
MTTTTTGFPGFAPGEHRQLLADIHRWARTNDWATTRDIGWWSPDRLSQVDWDERGLSIGTRDTTDNLWKTRHWPADSVREAIDLLVALGIAPEGFSSAYKAGWDDCATLTNAHFDELKLAAQDGVQ